MTKSYTFRPAQRSESKPLIGLYSESGCGKTYSALALARGFVGPTGRIGMIETESGRGEAYSDPAEYPEFAWQGNERNYLVTPMRENFSPKEYGAAISAAEKANLDALIIDSASHEWEGEGGVLSMAAENQAKGKKGQLVWQEPKMDHTRHFMLRFTQTPIPLVILCMRAKYPMREGKGQNGEKVWIRSEVLEPKQSDDILYEMFVHGWIGPDHKFNLNKCTARGLEAVFKTGVLISPQTGRDMAVWAAKAKAAEPAKVAAESAPPPETKTETLMPGHPDYEAAVKARAELVALAELAAKGGYRELSGWWRALPQVQQDSLGPDKARLVQLARDSDAETLK